MTTGQSTQLSLTAKATLTKSAAEAIDGRPVTHAAATLKPTATFGTAATVVTQTVQRTMLSEAPPTLLTGASVPVTYTAPASPGALEVTAGGIDGTLRFDHEGDAATEKKFICTAPNGKAPVIDTIAISASATTTLTLARSTSAYGQAVSASAKVTSSAGTPAGEVAFTVGDVVTRAKVDKDGVASLVLPDSAAGTHTVVATFAPSDVSTVTRVAAKARIRLGKLDKGRCKAVVTYRGDTNHLDARKTMTFRVKPG